MCSSDLDQVQHVAASLGVQGDVVQRRLLVGTRSATGPALADVMGGVCRLCVLSFVAMFVHGVFQSCQTVEPRCCCIGGFRSPMLGQCFAAIE